MVAHRHGLGYSISFVNAGRYEPIQLQIYTLWKVQIYLKKEASRDDWQGVVCPGAGFLLVSCWLLS